MTEDKKASLLKSILRDEKTHEAPHTTKRHGVHYEFLVGIGKDETATITMTDDAYKAIIEMSEVK